MRVAPIELPLSEIRRELDRIRHPFRVAIQRAKNPFNVGAIVRTAHSFLAREVFLLGEARYYRRAAMGMDRYENVVELAHDEQLVERARAQRWPLVVFEKDHARSDLWKARLPADCVMVFGNEDTGVGDTLIAAADEVVGIPLYGINHSLPLAVAAGIGMAEWCRRWYAHGRVVTG